MVIAGWRKNFEVLADAGQRACRNCHHTTRHFLVGERKEVRLYFVPVAKFGRKRNIVCEVCGHATPVNERDAGVLMRQVLQSSAPPAAMAPPAPPAPAELEKGILQRGALAARESLERMFPQPWTTDVLDAGLREELGPTLLSSTQQVAVRELGADRAAALVAHFGLGAARVEQLIRADAAMTAALPRAQAQASNAAEVVNHLIGAVMTELGISQEEAASLATVVMSD